MRIFEVANDAPHLFLDMDGVQADLFPVLASIENQQQWKHVPDPEDAITRLSKSGPERVYQLFATLPVLEGGQTIIRWLHSNKIPFTVLSAPLRGEPDASIAGKKAWLDKHNPGTSSNAIFTSKKQQYATQGGKANVLVDDFNHYLENWHNAGGIAVKHKEETTAQTIASLEKVYGAWLIR